MNKEFSNKLVAIVNEKIELGVAMNALAHICLGFGAELGKDNLHLTNYVDADNNSHDFVSKMPFIILKANSNKIRATKQLAMDLNIKSVDFINTMTGGTYQNQLENTKKTKDLDLIYYAIVLYGPWDKVAEITKKFSLLK